MRYYAPVGVLVVFITLCFATLTSWHRPDTDLTTFPLLKDASLDGRTIVDFSAPQNGVVSYTYLDAPVAQTLTEREVPEMRDASSFTELVSVQGEGSDAELTLKTVFYTQPTFARDTDGTWRYLEHATTTQEAFRNRDLTLYQALREMLVHTAYADTVTAYTNESGDGYFITTAIEASAAASWSTAHSRTDADGYDTTDHAAWIYSYADTYDCCTWMSEIHRAVIPFDTSAVPSAAVISAATLNLFAYASIDSTLDGYDYVTVTTSTTATHTALVVSDYSKAGDITLSPASEVIDTGDRITVAGTGISTYWVFPFNANGIAAIKKSGQSSTCSATAGITCLAARTGNDAENVLPPLSGELSFSFNTAEWIATDQDPYLEITYSIPMSTVAGSGRLAPGGAFRIVGGKLRIQ